MDGGKYVMLSLGNGAASRWAPPFCKGKALTFQPLTGGGVSNFLSQGLATQKQIDQYTQAVSIVNTAVQAGRDPLPDLQGKGLLGVVKHFRYYPALDMCGPPHCKWDKLGERNCLVAGGHIPSPTPGAGPGAGQIGPYNGALPDPGAGSFWSEELVAGLKGWQVVAIGGGGLVLLLLLLW